jgi:hypothetical protein
MISRSISVGPSKPFDLPPAVARTFVDDMRAFFAEEDKHKQDAIAVRQLNALKEPRETPLMSKSSANSRLRPRPSTVVMGRLDQLVGQLTFVRKSEYTQRKPEQAMPQMRRTLINDEGWYRQI